jgi:phospho-N-acetylmuramoyl-pentapeptide-transferase
VIYMLYRAFSTDPSSELAPFASIRAIAAFLTAFLIVWMLAPRVIAGLYRRGLRDRPRDYVDAWAFSKSGTPTMGGILIVLGIMAAALVWCDLSSKPIPLLLLATTFFAGLGALDDILKTKRRSSDGGLGRRFKLVSQGLFGLFFALIMMNDGTAPFIAEERARVYIPLITPLLGCEPDLGGIGYGALILLAFLAISNAVNFADGLDGLAIVPAALAVAVYGIIAYILGRGLLPDMVDTFTRYLWMQELSLYCCALLGAATGFLWFNGYPAQVFMGDTGSLSLGGTLAAMAVLTKQELLFLLLGAVFVLEFVSVLIQDTLGIARLGRRIFYRAPMHHSYQHQGVAETKVVLRFWIMSLLFALIGLGTWLGGPRMAGGDPEKSATRGGAPIASNGAPPVDHPR